MIFRKCYRSKIMKKFMDSCEITSENLLSDDKEIHDEKG